MSDLSISLLGNCRITLDQRPLVHFRTKSVQALLIYLACELGRPHQREALTELLWPGLPAVSGQANMRQTLYRLRKLIPEVKGKTDDVVPFLISTRQTIEINPEADFYLDISRLPHVSPSEAIALYMGNFLVDFYLADSEAFETWAAHKREHYRHQFLEILGRQTAEYLDQANYAEAIQLAQKQLTLDNLRESGHRQLMEALAKNGRRQEAVAHYGRVVQLLQHELSIEPSQETRMLIEAIRAESFATQPDNALPSHNEPPPRKHNLSQRLTSFVGRKDEMATIRNLIQQHRLVMLTGTGGIGKTNLCIEVGSTLLSMFPDGVWLVELASISDPALIPQTAANALNLEESAEMKISEVLFSYLHNKKCLLILDNCEHLIDAAAKFVEAVLQSGANVKVLASSREALGISGEIPYRVPPLSVPEEHQTTFLVDWDQYDAVRLFVERAIVVMPNFRVTEQNSASLIKICQRLEGIPLAIELAAARIGVLDIQQIAERLDDRFRLLTGGSRTALPRQQTLKALIDWSWDLLTEKEQLLLGRLSVFASGMSLKAVEAICHDDGLEIYELLNLLSELVNKSLVITQHSPGHPARYKLLETIRHYAQDRLFSTGRSSIFRQNHLAYFLQLAEQTDVEPRGADEAISLKRLTLELDNFRAAFTWANGNGDTEAVLRLASALAEMHWSYEESNEWEDWLTHALSNAGEIPLQIKAKALLMQSSLSFFRQYKLKHFFAAQHADAIDAVGECLALYEQLGDDKGMADALLLKASLLEKKHLYSEVQNVLHKSLALYRKVESHVGVAKVLEFLGVIEGRFNYKKALAYFEKSETLYREAGNLYRTAFLLEHVAQVAFWEGDFILAQAKSEASLSMKKTLGIQVKASVWQVLGDIYVRLNDYTKARHLYELSIINSRQAGYIVLVYWGIVRMAYLDLRQGNIDEACSRFIDGIEFFNDSEVDIGLVYALEGFANIALAQADAKKATIFVAWADAKREAIQKIRPTIEENDIQHILASIQHLITPEAFAEYYTKGQTLTQPQIVELAGLKKQNIGILQNI